MDHQFLHEIYSGIEDIGAFLCLMIGIMPSNEIKIVILVFNLALRHGGPAYITDDVIHAILSGLMRGRRTINIKAVRIITITLIFYFLKFSGIQLRSHPIE